MPENSRASHSNWLPVPWRQLGNEHSFEVSAFNNLVHIMSISTEWLSTRDNNFKCNPSCKSIILALFLLVALSEPLRAWKETWYLCTGDGWLQTQTGVKTSLHRTYNHDYTINKCCMSQTGKSIKPVISTSLIGECYNACLISMNDAFSCDEQMSCINHESIGGSYMICIKYIVHDRDHVPRIPMMKLPVPAYS